MVPWSVYPEKKNRLLEFTLKDHNHNLKYNLVHEFFWGFGIAFHTIYAVVPLFLKNLGAPESIAVSSAGLFNILIALPMLAISALGRNIQNIKRSVIIVHSLVIIVLFMMGFTFTFINIDSLKVAWVVYFIYFLLYGLSIGIVVPIWAEFLKKTTLKSERGQFFGLSFAFNSIGSFVGGIVLRLLLNSDIPFPKNFGVGFIILFFSIVLGTLVFLFYRVKPETNLYHHKSIKDFILETKQIIKGHKNFQYYLLSRIFFCASLPGMGLYAIYCQKKFNFDISEAGIFTILNVIASGAASYLVGKIGDRWGHKKGMIIAYVAHFSAVIVAIYSNNMYWVYGIFIIMGIGNGAFMPSAMNLVYDFAQDRDTKTYMALIDSFLAPFVVFFLTSVGFFVQNNNYTIVFNILGSCLILSIFLICFLVKDPRNSKYPDINVDRFSS